MIEISKCIDDCLICESGFGRVKHIFNDGELTFADIRDIFQKIFSGEIQMTEKIDGQNLLITFKDGDFCVAYNTKTLKNPIKYKDISPKTCKVPPELCDAFQNSVKDLDVALSEIDPVALNRYFANGQNFLDCQLVYPPCQNILDYGNRCLMTLNCIRCYNDKFAEIGEDKDSAAQLFKLLRGNSALQQEMFELSVPNALAFKNMTSSREAMQKILEKLNEFINGVGWKCSLNQYVQDRYSRHIVNKALEHGIDVSRTSDFVNALAARLSQISGAKPTKSDLVTYAKCDGVNYRDPEYRAFIEDLENNSESTNAEIIKPVEDLIMWACETLMKNVTGYIAADPSKTAKKLYSQLQDAIREADSSDSGMTPERISRFKKSLARLAQYQECSPAEGILITWKGKAYKLTGCFGPISELLGIVKYK